MNYLQKELYELVNSKNDIFDFLQEASLDGLWYRDVENPENEWMNTKFWITLGYDPNEMSDKAAAWQHIVHPDDLKVATDNFNKHYADPDHPYDQVVRYTHKNGSTVWFRCRGMAIRNEEGKAIRMLVVHTNITREKINEGRLNARNNILQSTIESYKDVLIFSIDRQYRYLIFNQAFKSATYKAYGTTVVVGDSMLDSITDAGDREKAKANCDRAMSGDSHVTIEAYGDLERLYFETRYNAILNDENEVTGVTVMSSNITERIKAEEQLKALNKELNSFAYSVSHDLRAPLRAINGNASILLEDFQKSLNEEGKRSIEIICRSSKKMGNLIDDLLTFSRLGRNDITRSKVDMENIVRSTVEEIYGESLPDKTTFHISKIPHALGDYALLKQVWYNLISNAVKYSDTNTTPTIEIGGILDTDVTTYYVKDNGVGFDMKYYDKLFGVFQRLHGDDEFEGTGVGLAIVHRIVTKHGGKVWAESKVNEGASFFFAIPAFQS